MEVSRESRSRYYDPRSTNSDAVERGSCHSLARYAKGAGHCWLFFAGPLPSWGAGHQQSPPYPEPTLPHALCPLQPCRQPPFAEASYLPSASEEIVLLITTRRDAGGDAKCGKGHAHPCAQSTRALAASLSLWDESSPRHPSTSLGHNLTPGPRLLTLPGRDSEGKSP